MKESGYFKRIRIPGIETIFAHSGKRKTASACWSSQLSPPIPIQLKMFVQS